MNCNSKMLATALETNNRYFVNFIYLFGAPQSKKTAMKPGSNKSYYCFKLNINNKVFSLNINNSYNTYLIDY